MTQMDADKEKDKQTHVVIGAAMAVHRQLGHGFLEPVYEEALECELVEWPILMNASLPCQFCIVANLSWLPIGRILSVSVV
jgi:hypothetical protein